jgi:mutator protein MutT
MSKSETKLLTLCVIYRDGQILLGMKKRGFGMGLWNGFGGKVQEGETIEQAAVRELQEEAQITPQNLQARGILTFRYGNDSKVLEVHLFSASKFEGEPVETEEMRPQWFKLDTINYTLHHPDDRYWLPLILDGKNIQGEFFFKDTDTLIKHTLKIQ